MSFSCFSIELEKLLNAKKLPYKMINTQRIKLKNLKKWSTNVTHKVIEKPYSKIDPQTLLKKWSTNVTQKLNHKRYSKINPQTLLKSDPQMLLKDWPRNVTQL